MLQEVVNAVVLGPRHRNGTGYACLPDYFNCVSSAPQRECGGAEVRRGTALVHFAGPSKPWAAPREACGAGDGVCGAWFAARYDDSRARVAVPKLLSTLAEVLGSSSVDGSSAKP